MMPSGFIGISQSATERLEASMSHYTRDKGPTKAGISDGNRDSDSGHQELLLVWLMRFLQPLSPYEMMKDSSPGWWKRPG